MYMSHPLTEMITIEEARSGCHTFYFFPCYLSVICDSQPKDQLNHQPQPDIFAGK